MTNNHYKNTEGLLDAGKLQSIRELTEAGEEEDFLSSLIHMFFERTPQLLDEIQQGISQNNGKKLEFSAHALKGTAGNIGAYPLMKVCEQLEERGRILDFSDVTELLSELEDIFTATADALKEQLSQQGQSA
ncbi:MAG: Hpt domain-containing protein [Oligoflexus sp.]